MTPAAKARRVRTVRRTTAARPLLLKSPVETERLGRRLGRALQAGDVVALYGELGAGKTALVRGMAAGLGASPDAVSSPTFVLIHEYRGRLRLAHADLYRIDSAAELTQLGLPDYDDGRTAFAIEWADKAGDELPADRLEIRLSHRGSATREAGMAATGTASRRLLARITARRPRR
jgi:tRNA threonylcarbamoyladenosine biosynthesis protein TsaE